MTGLSYEIQDEFNVLNFHSVVEAYQSTLRIEEKLLRKQHNVRISPRYGWHKQQEKQVEEGESDFSEVEGTTGKRFDVDKGCGWTIRGRGRASKFEIIFFKCGIADHKALECPKKDGRKPDGKTHSVEA